MDPFVVVSFGKKVFRTRVIRHSLNPVWDEKLFFHVRRYETNYKLQLSVLDWDKLSSNDHVGDASFDVNELIKNAPKKDETTGMYPENSGKLESEMKEFKLNLTTEREMPWETKHNPVLTVRWVSHVVINAPVRWADASALTQREVSALRFTTSTILARISQRIRY